MSEIEFLGALGVELLRHGELRPEHPDHELFQTSTVQALLAGAFDGDVTLAEILEHGDLGLGTLNGLDGELIVLDGQAWKAELDCTLVRPDPSDEDALRGGRGVLVRTSRVAAGRTLRRGRELEAHLGERVSRAMRPTAIRIDGRFDGSARALGAAPAPALPPARRGDRPAADQRAARRLGHDDRASASPTRSTASRSSARTCISSPTTARAAGTCSATR